VANYPAPTVFRTTAAATAKLHPAVRLDVPIGTNTVTCTATDASGNNGELHLYRDGAAQPTCSYSKAVVSGQAKPGQLLTYTIIVHQHRARHRQRRGSERPVVPQGTTFSAVSTTQGTFTAPPVARAARWTVNLGTLANGASAKITLTIKVSLRSNALIVNHRHRDLGDVRLRTWPTTAPPSPAQEDQVSDAKHSQQLQLRRPVALRKSPVKSCGIASQGCWACLRRDPVCSSISGCGSNVG